MNTAKIIPSIMTGILLLSACGGGGNGNSNNDISFAIAANAGAGGEINPGAVIVNEGETTRFTVTPDNGFTIDSITGCNGSLTGDIYTTGNITADCEVAATFTQDNNSNSFAIAANAGAVVRLTPVRSSLMKVK
jgi:hypothetical protein